MKLRTKAPQKHVRNLLVKLWIVTQCSLYVIGEGHVTAEARQAGPRRAKAFLVEQEGWVAL